MKVIDAVIDNEPTEQRIFDLVELKNRNILAFRELKNFNDKGKWVNKHPLLVQNSIRAKYKQLLEKEPAKFLQEYANTANNVSRYTSFTNSKSRSEEKRESDLKNLNKHREREAIMREILEEGKK